MASFNGHSQQSPRSLPTELALRTLSQFYDFDLPQHTFEQDKYNPPQSSFDTAIGSSPSPQSSYSNIQSSTSIDDDNPLRNRTFWVYKHMPDMDIGTKYYNTTNKLEWRCRYCTKRYTINGGTRLIKLHLKSTHDISELSARQERSIKRQMSIKDGLAAATSNPQKRRRLGGK
jgi:hypothetical protein